MQNQNRLISIYLLKIQNTYYVGSSMNTQVRFNKHICGLKNNFHHNPGLQNAYNKYQTMECFILEFGSHLNNLNLLEREQFWYDQLKHTMKLVNSSSFVDRPTPGRKSSPPKDPQAWKAKIKASLLALSQKGYKNPFLGKRHTEESLQKMISKKTGKVVSIETKQKMKQAHSGAKMTEESVARAVQTRRNSGLYHQPGYFVRICLTLGEELNRYSCIKELISADLCKTSVYKAIRNNTVYRNSKWKKEPML